MNTNSGHVNSHGRRGVEKVRKNEPLKTVKYPYTKHTNCYKNKYQDYKESHNLASQFASKQQQNSQEQFQTTKLAQNKISK